MHGSGLLRPGWTHVQHLKHTDSNPCSTIVFKQNWEIIRYVKYTRKPPTDVLYHSSYKMTLNQEHHVVLRSLLKLRQASTGEAGPHQSWLVTAHCSWTRWGASSHSPASAPWCSSSRGRTPAARTGDCSSSHSRAQTSHRAPGQHAGN